MVWGLVLAVGLIASLPTAAAAEDDRAVIQVDLYRAMRSRDVGAYPIQNFNLASIAGASKYIHTDVITEHLTDPERKERRNGIDSIARMRFKVKNPSRVVAPASPMATQMDFGPFVLYDSGAATNPRSHALIQEYGSYVGVQLQTDARWPYTEPYVWFSVTGWCPNMRYEQVPMSRREAEDELEARSRICEGLWSEAACA